MDCEAAAASPQAAGRPSGPYRVLSLDGGGIKGTFAASFLATLEKLSGRSVASHFDLIAGTSTGGIIGLGLGLGFTAQEILDFYLERGPQIFPATGAAARGLKALRHTLFAKYDARDLRVALRDIFGSRKLGDSSVRLVIPSFDAASGDIHLFKTAHHPRFKTDYRRDAVEVALATAAAPTYFAHFKREDGARFIDGGVWANNPTAVALIEAMAILGWPREEIDLLSIGTVSSPYHVPSRKLSAGWLRWHKHLVELLLNAQQAGAVGMAAVLTDHFRMLRVDETATPGRFRFDDTGEIKELCSLGRYAARHMEKEVTGRFLSGEAAPFEPCHRT